MIINEKCFKTSLPLQLQTQLQTHLMHRWEHYLTINLYQTKSAQSWPFALGERMLKLWCSALTHPSSISSFLFTILLLMMVRLDPGHLDVPTVSHVVQVIICYWWQPHQPAGGDNSTSQQNSKRPKVCLQKKKIAYNETLSYSPFTPSLPTLNRTKKYRT